MSRDPNYEAAKEKMNELCGLPVSVNVSDYLTIEMKGEERRQALDALKQADREAEEENLAIVKAIVDAALVDPSEEAQTP